MHYTLDTSHVQSGNPHPFPLHKKEGDKIAVQLKYWCAKKKIVNCDAPKGTTRKKKKKKRNQIWQIPWSVLVLPYKMSARGVVFFKSERNLSKLYVEDKKLWNMGLGNDVALYLVILQLVLL